jgi:hypothetical protein
VAVSLRFACAFAATLLVGVACAQAEKPGHLAPQDKQDPPGDAEFDPDKIISFAELTDNTVRAELIRALITYREVDKTRKSPYGQDSFLATYYSNGLSAVDALTQAEEKYGINPLVILVRAEMEQGLVALKDYPIDDPARVEYAFRCGCTGPDSCDPIYAGFDQQVDCLARQYRIILDDLKVNPQGATSGGWKGGVTSTTADGQSVTPADDGTAVAYQFDPRVGNSESGNHLFWNIWTLYVQASNYQGPTGAAPAGAWIGDPCTANNECKAIGNGAACVTTYPGGMCTVPCPTGACPAREGREAVCISIPAGGPYCFNKCNPNADCRGESTEWACCSSAIYPQPPAAPDPVTSPVCLPKPTCDSN